MAKQKRSTPGIGNEKIIELAETFKLMGDPSRLRIIIRCLEGPACVSDIVKSVGLSQSLVSHHLRLLRATLLLKAERRGRQMFYMVADDHIHCVITDMMDHVGEAENE